MLPASARPGASALVLGLLNAALPFWLVAWGEQHIDSGTAGDRAGDRPDLLAADRAPVPAARADRPRDGSSASASGSSGSRSSPASRPAGDAWAVAGTLAVVLASVFYASAGIYGQLHLEGTTSGPVLATGSMLAAA